MRLDFNLICAKHILNMLKIVYIVYIAPSFLQSRYYGSGLFKLNKLYHLLLIFYFFWSVKRCPYMALFLHSTVNW